MWVWFFVFFGFPEGVYKTKQTFEKTKNTKENQKTLLEIKKKTTLLKVSDPRLDVGLFFLFFWLSLMFCWFCKNLRENRKNKKQKKYPRVGLKPLKTLLFCCFPEGCLLFSLVFFCMFGFL